ncbi:MAG: ABC transporter substrate-binding protein [Oscillospiraceae bacterium]|nr:ABC transporter substrate-binding protein [Oscillospiraceae bacterium]
MKKKIKKTVALMLALAITVMSAGCGAADRNAGGIPVSTGGRDIEKGYAADRVFSLNSNSNFSLNPSVATNHSNQLICSLVYENLVEVDNNFEVIEGAGLIKEWSVSEDGLTWYLTYDTTHVFHDGTPVKGNDLRMSIEYCINSDRYTGRFASVQGVSWTETQLIITLGIPNKQFIKLLNIPVVKVGTNGDPHPIGSGPYMYNEDGTELLAFEGYNGYDKLPVDVIYLKEYFTAEDIISAFEDSYIDVIVNDPSSYTNLGYASSNETRTFATTNMHYIAFNEESPTCRYNNIRAALQYGFDREYLAEEMLHGNGVASAVPMYPTCAAYPTELANSLAFDLDKCKTILQNFGLKDSDGDGRFDSMTGAGELTFTMLLCSDSSAKAGMARKFADDMNSIGITVKIYELGWDDYLKALEEGEIEVNDNRTVQFDMYYAEVKLRNDFDMTELLQVRAKDNEKTNINFTRSHDASYETYINNYLAAADAGRATAYYAFCYYLSNNAAIIPLGFEKQQIITHRGVIKGVDANAGNPLYNFQNWEIDLS